MKPRNQQALRCAIYTRKSSEEGLEQDFNSLHAQREACEAYIRSQQGEGWRLHKTAYDDGGPVSVAGDDLLVRPAFGGLGLPSVFSWCPAPVRIPPHIARFAPYIQSSSVVLLDARDSLP